MRPVFGTDITTDRRNDWSNSDEFIRQQVGDELKKRLDGAYKSSERMELKSCLPWYALALKWLAGAAALCGLYGAITFFLDHAPNDLLQCLPGLIVFLAGGGIWLALFIYAKKRERTVMASSEAYAANEELERALGMAKAELGVHDDAEAVDVFLLSYKVKNGKISIVDPWLMLNAEVKAYRQNDALMLFGNKEVWAFPLENMKAIRTVKSSVTAPFWNKKEKPRKGEFAKYKLIPNNYGVRMRCYHILELEHGGEPYGIYFPCWELPVLERLTGLKAEA